MKVRGRLQKTGIWSQESGVNYTLTATEVIMMICDARVYVCILRKTYLPAELGCPVDFDVGANNANDDDGDNFELVICY